MDETLLRVAVLAGAVTMFFLALMLYARRPQYSRRSQTGPTSVVSTIISTTAA